MSFQCKAHYSSGLHGNKEFCPSFFLFFFFLNIDDRQEQNMKLLLARDFEWNKWTQHALASDHILWPRLIHEFTVSCHISETENSCLQEPFKSQNISACSLPSFAPAAGSKCPSERHCDQRGVKFHIKATRERNHRAKKLKVGHDDPWQRAKVTHSGSEASAKIAYKKHCSFWNDLYLASRPMACQLSLFTTYRRIYSIM